MPTSAPLTFAVDVEVTRSETVLGRGRRCSGVTDRGLFPGRFQPFHLGHLDAVVRLSRQHEQLIVAVGSAQVSHTESNPFTAGERIEMIDAALREAGVTNVLLLALPDVGRNAVWVSHVRSYVPAFEVLYTNNPLMARLFGEAGIKVAPAPFHERASFEGTRIRRIMADGGDWSALAPPAVARVIERIDGAARVRDVTRATVVVEGKDASV